MHNNDEVKKNVLIVHGWMHSANRYRKLAEKINNCNVHTIDLPGFGDNEYFGPIEEVEENHIKYLQALLIKKKYDFVIAHSWGDRFY